MNKPKDKLYRLIKSMTPAEKRYFKMHFALQTNALSILYDLINESEQYDEEEVKRLLPPNIANKLKVYKVRLYDRVLKSLTTYYAKKNIQSKIRLGLEEVDVLMLKQLYDVAADHLYKIKKIGERYEEYTYLIDIAYIEFRLMNIYMDRVGISKQPLFTDMTINLEKLDQQIKLSQLAHKSIDFQKANHYKELTPEQKEWLTNIHDFTLPELAQGAISFKAKLSRNIILTVIYQFLKNTDQEFIVRRENVDLFHQYPHFKESLSFNYLAVLRNYMNFCLKNYKYDEVRNAVTEAKQFIVKATPHEEPQLIYFYYSELQMLYEEGRFKTIVKEYSPLIERFTKKNNITGERISVICFIYIILAELFENNHHNAQYYLRIINNAHSEVKEYFEEFFILLDLISHYEAIDTHSLKIQLQKLKRKFHITDHPDTFFKSMINWIDRLIKYPEQKAIIAIEMKTECNLKFSSDKNMNSFQNYHLDSWCGALIHGSSLKEEILLHLKSKSPSYK